MGKRLIDDPERAPLVRCAFEQYETGRCTKEQLLKRARTWGLTSRRGKPLTSQTIGTLLRNQLSAGMPDEREYGVRSQRLGFGPLVSDQRRWRFANAQPDPDFR